MRRMNARILEKEALGLPPDKRAKLAQRLLQSLDELSEAQAEKLWLEEASQRAREIDAGKVSLVKPQELERRVRARIKRNTRSIRRRRSSTKTRSRTTKPALPGLGADTTLHSCRLCCAYATGHIV